MLTFLHFKFVIENQLTSIWKFNLYGIDPINEYNRIQIQIVKFQSNIWTKIKFIAEITIEEFHLIWKEIKFLVHFVLLFEPDT